MDLVAVEVLVVSVEDQGLSIADLNQFQTVVGKRVGLIGRVVGLFVATVAFLAALAVVATSVVAVVVAAGAVGLLVILGMVVSAAKVVDQQLLVVVRLQAVEVP
jgi:small-conductance mechanosensitive channel